MNYLDILRNSPDMVSPGVSACQGCGGELVLRRILQVAGKNTIVCVPPGCMAGSGVVGWNFDSGMKIPVHIPLLDNAASFLSGVTHMYQEVIQRSRRRQGSDPLDSPLFNRHCVYKPQRSRKGIVDTACCCIHIGMHTNSSDLILHQCAQQPPLEIIIPEGLNRVPGTVHHRVVRHNKAAAQLPGLLNHLHRNIQRNQHTVYRLLNNPNQQSDIVPALRQVFGGQLI